MLVSTGPRLQHFSNSPTSEEVINAELFLAMHSPYKFTQEEDLFCYESMPSHLAKEEESEKVVTN
jgi:hypothetical protein